jgi:hypothetical protein
MGSLLKFCVVFVFLFSLLSVSFPLVSATNGEVYLEEAEEALVLAYDAVLEAEEAGADVIGLLEKLNVGGQYLAEAYAYVRLGDSESVERAASLCIEAVDGVEAEAVLLGEEAARSERADVLVRVLDSFVGVVIVLVIGFVLWEVFKQHYHKKVLKSRPEVVSSES